MIREISSRIIVEAFEDEAPLRVATGGFSHLFDDQDLFDVVYPDLILIGLHEALKLNGYINGQRSL